jgi:AraC-like DNA-binding protein
MKPGAERAFVWKYSHAIGGRRPRHFHVEPELNLVVSGSATFGIGNAVACVSRGDLVAFPPGQDHALLAASPDLFLYAVGLDPVFSAQVLGREHAAGLPLHVSVAPQEFAILESRAGAIVERNRTDSLAAELWERSHAVGGRSAPMAGRAIHVLTRRTLQLLTRGPELGLDDVSRYLRAHPSEVSRHFHQDMGVTFVRYRTRLRLLQIIRQVDSGEKDLMADGCGLDNSSLAASRASTGHSIIIPITDTASQILLGRRELSKGHIRVLSEHFKIGAGYFL